MPTSVSLLPDRLLEQTESWTTWARRCWEPSTILQLKELCEATSWARKGVLSETAVSWLRTRLRTLIGADRGLAEGAIKAQLDNLLKNDLSYGSQAQRQLEQLVTFIEDGYLQRWKGVIAGPDEFDTEKASRYISAHVIDSGYHPEWLRSTMHQMIRSGAGAVDIVEELISLLNQSEREFAGVVPLLQIPEMELMTASSNWLSAAEVAALLRNSTSDKANGLRHIGGLKFSIRARDIRSATTEIADRMERLVSRTRFLRGYKKLEYATHFFTDDGDAFELRLNQPNIEILALQRTRVLYSASLTDERANAVDDALHLASNLLDGPATVAAAGAWAALESLFVTGTDSSVREVGRSIAADRAAALIASSWPRSELTRLSHRNNSRSSRSLLDRELAGVGDYNAERARIVLDWLRAGKSLQLRDLRDQAAELRMRELIENPHSVLLRVQRYMTGSLRRLYRQRNLVLHGGAAKPIALRATIRTAGPLVGAALDRVSYAYELHGMAPLDAVARAECALKGLKDGSGWPLHDLAAA